MGKCFWFETDTNYVAIFLVKKIESTIGYFNVKIDLLKKMEVI